MRRPAQCHDRCRPRSHRGAWGGGRRPSILHVGTIDLLNLPPTLQASQHDRGERRSRLAAPPTATPCRPTVCAARRGKSAGPVCPHPACARAPGGVTIGHSHPRQTRFQISQRHMLRTDSMHALTVRTAAPRHCCGGPGIQVWRRRPWLLSCRARIATASVAEKSDGNAQNPTYPSPTLSFATPPSQSGKHFNRTGGSMGGSVSADHG